MSLRMEKRRKILVQLAILIHVHVALESISSNMQLMLSQLLQVLTILAFYASKTRARNRHGLCNECFADRNLVSSYNSNMFKETMHISKHTFKFLCQTLGEAMTKQDTNMRRAIPLETRICIALRRLTTGNTLQSVSDSFGIGTSTCHSIIMNFCEAIKTKLHPICVCWPSREKMKQYDKDFENIKGIPYVIGAVGASHIPIIAPREHADEYYNRRGFHSVWLQMIVNSKGYIWNYDIGWAGAIHDGKLFHMSETGKRCERGELGEYCLVGDVVHPPRQWMLSPFRASKDSSSSSSLSAEQLHWNLLHHAMRMPIERTLGMLKVRFRIMMRRNDMMLKSIPKMVSTCLVLHNLCIMRNDGINDAWLNEAIRELRLESSTTIAAESSEVSRVATFVAEELSLSKGDIGNNEQIGDDPESNPIVFDPFANKGEERRNKLAQALYAMKNKRPREESLGDGDECDSD